MSERLDRRAVKRWLSDQRAAEERIARERLRALLVLTPERSLKLYLDLSASIPVRHSERPSPVLWAMRRSVGRRSIQAVP